MSGEGLGQIGTHPNRYFGAAASTPWPDCSEKRVKAPKGLLPREIPEQLKFGRNVTLIGMWPKRYFGPAAPNPCPDCSGKPVRALKGLLPGEQPKQLKFVMGKDVLWHP